MDVGSTVTLRGYLKNNTDKGMFATVELLGNNNARIDPAGSEEFHLERNR